MNRPPYRSLCAVVALTLFAAGWLPAGDQSGAAGPSTPPGAPPTVIAFGTAAARPADAPAATPAPVTAAPARAPVAADKEGEKSKNQGRQKAKGKKKEQRKGKDSGAAADKDKDAGEDEEAGKDEDLEAGEDDEVEGPAIDRLRAFYPETIKDFRRTDFHPFDPDGDDASVGYNLFQNDRVTWVTFTAYFYPARGDSLDEDLKHAIRDVTGQHKKAKVGEPEVVEVTRRGQRHEGRRVRFEFTHAFRDKVQPLASELYLFPGAPGRLVKYRITFPAADAETLQEKVDEFAESFPWPRGL